MRRNCGLGLTLAGSEYNQIMTPKDLIKLLHAQAVTQGETIGERQGWLYALALKDGRVMEARTTDEGYTHSICVKGLVSAWLFNEGTYTESVVFMLGDGETLLTLARNLGLTWGLIPRKP